VIASIAAALLMASAAIAVLADLGITHAAPVYLLAVVAIGMHGPIGSQALMVIGIMVMSPLKPDSHGVGRAAPAGP
jgi:hypothetical protein